LHLQGGSGASGQIDARSYYDLASMRGREGQSFVTGIWKKSYETPPPDSSGQATLGGKATSALSPKVFARERATLASSSVLKLSACRRQKGSRPSMAVFLEVEGGHTRLNDQRSMLVIKVGW
jgi:hypothetical protein